VLGEVAELTSQNQALNKTFMALAGEAHTCMPLDASQCMPSCQVCINVHVGDTWIQYAYGHRK
jgi:hypothetical protein